MKNQKRIKPRIIVIPHYVGTEKAGDLIKKSHDHRFKRWFDISPIRALILARLKGGHRKPITGNL